MRGVLPHQLALPEFGHQLHSFCSRRSYHKLSRVSRFDLLRQSPFARGTMAPGYEQWTHEQLVARIKDLESQLRPENKVTTKNIAEPNPATFTSSPIPAPGQGENALVHREQPKQPPKAFDASRYNTRLIALKFAYLGQKYCGLEHHANNPTPFPTIEEELWKALMKTRLIVPIPRGDDEAETYERLDRKTFERWDRDGVDVNWEGCEYSKCGRTDRGVSAFGQVVGMRVRSKRPMPKPSPALPTSDENSTGDATQEFEIESSIEDVQEDKPFDEVKDELPYIQLLNRVLPPDIRVYAWCPNPPPNFSARFSCKERRYKYFFTNPCFAPVPGTSGLYTPDSSNASTSMREGLLDMEKMREACKLLEGLHDFRNFCKIDPSKQITNFHRRIFHASIEEVSPVSIPSFLKHPEMQNPSSPDAPKMYAFVLHGSAFLWHQVRSIVAILFLIGQRREAPSLITDLMDIEKNPTRPKYEMASDAPLVLWDCIFPAEEDVQDSDEREHGYTDALPWIHVGDEGGTDYKYVAKIKPTGPSTMGRGKWGRGGVIDDVWELWREHKIDETLSALLLDTIAATGSSTLDREQEIKSNVRPKGGPRTFDGSNIGKARGSYKPMLQRERQEPVEVVNARYAKKKGLDTNRKKPRVEDADE